MTFVDITCPRVGSNAKTPSGIDSEFAKFNDQIKDLPEAKLLRDLRNFLLHVGNAPYLFHVDFSPKKSGLKLERETLLTWPNWSAPARSYIEEHRNDLYLRNLVLSYQKKITELHEWADAQFDTMHGAEVAKFHEMEDRAIAFYEQQVARRPRPMRRLH